MKKRSDKIIALLLCAFMAFSLIAAAADDPAQPCADCGQTQGHGENCAQNPPPAQTEEPAAQPETSPETEPTPEPETPAETEPTQTPAPSEAPAETPAPSQAPVESPAPSQTPTETESEAEPETDAEPAELEETSLNGDANGMNFTVAGVLPKNSKLQVTAIDPSCNDYIVGNYLSDVALPQGVAMAFELSILTVEEQDGVEQKTVYVPTAANGLTVTVSGSKEDCFVAMSVYHLPGVTAKQVEGAVKALAEGEVSPEDLAAAQPAALDADGNPLRYYNQMNVTAYGEGKKLFTFPADGLSVFYLVAEVGSEHVDGCPGEGCTIENCPCQCHGLYARLMACTTVEELQAALENVTEEDLADLTEMQIAALQAHILSIAPDQQEEPQTVVFTNAGPFMPPVEVAVSGSGN